MKRFWVDARAEPVGDAWQVVLDGKPVRLPGGGPLLLGWSALAAAVATEWQLAGGQKGGEMSYADVPLTRLAGTAQDRVAPQVAAVADDLARYGESDLLCYRAVGPAALVVRQEVVWQPWLDWVATQHGARLLVTSGVMHIEQDAAALAALRSAMHTLPAPALAALGLAVPAMGSLVLGLALAAGAVDGAAAAAAAQLDEAFQEELWGYDSEAAARRGAVARDIALAARFLGLTTAVAR